ncbi:MAG: phosphoribosylanthranilate isomerase [bacterium]
MAPLRIKICGITSLQDGRAAAEAGADYLGFICYDKSPRYVDPDLARKILEGLTPQFPNLSGVGVFVNEDPELAKEIVEEAGFQTMQLHGEENPESIESFVMPGIELFKAIKVRGRESLEAMAGFSGVDAFLCDAYDPNFAGGTGKSYDCRILRPWTEQFPIFLAGGLTPESVAGAILAAHPYGVDVSSGVEQRPGKKDHDKVRRFIGQARAAQKRLQLELDRTQRD